METEISKIDICGLDVRLVLTDDVDRVTDDKGTVCGGAYDVLSCVIWLNSEVALPVMQASLFHEVREFTLAHIGANYNPYAPHDFFSNFCDVLWMVCKANKEILFGGRLAELVCGVAGSGDNG